MADFFEELGKKISDAASEIGKTAEDALEIQKLKSNIRSLEMRFTFPYVKRQRRENMRWNVWRKRL